MSFSSTSIMLVFIIIGQMNLQDGIKPMPRLNSVDDVYSALRLSCRDMKNVGPLANIDIVEAVEFKRESMDRIETKKAEFIAEHCQKQKKDALKTYFYTEIMSPAVKAPYLLKESSSMLKPIAAPNAQAGSRFICDRDLAYDEFAVDFAGSVEDLEKQMIAFEDFTIPQFIGFYDYFCTDDKTKYPPSGLDYEQIAQEYNQLLDETEAVDLSMFNNFRTSRGADLVDENNEPIGPFITNGTAIDFVEGHKIPQVVKQAFVAIEDRNFYSHKGIEPSGILRGFYRHMTDGSVEGGSTITQQLVKNVLTGSERSLDRKAREMLLALRLEKYVGDKDKLMNAYLNIIDLGRGSKGISMAAKRYFGPNTKVEDLGLLEASFFAGITHRPANYNPSYATENSIRTRQDSVLSGMVELGFIDEAAKTDVENTPFNFVPTEFPLVSYFQASASSEYLRRTSEDHPIPTAIATTQNAGLQADLDVMVQKFLSRFEMGNGKVYWKGPLRNISYLWTSTDDEGNEVVDDVNLVENPEIWKAELIKSESLYEGVHWRTVVLLDKETKQIGVIDPFGNAEVKKLHFGDHGEWHLGISSKLKEGDVLFADDSSGEFYFRVPSTVQTAVVVMDVTNGEVKAVSGGFDYRMTPFNRAVDGTCQPGSTIKPFTYLAALEQGFSPSDIVSAGPVTFPKFPGCDPWTPDNFSADGSSQTSITNGLAFSNNRLTVNLAKKLAPDPVDALEIVYNKMIDFGLYDYVENKKICSPVLLGSEDVSPLRMARAYAAIANGGYVIEPTFLKDGQGQTQERTTYHVQTNDPANIGKLSEMLSQVVSRGTGSALQRHAGFVAGKTGTSNGPRDIWFVGYSNKHVVAAWMGYDSDTMTLPNGEVIKPFLGYGKDATGGRLVAPLVGEIFDRLFQSEEGGPPPLDPRTPLNFNHALMATNDDLSDRPLWESPDALALKQNPMDAPTGISDSERVFGANTEVPAQSEASEPQVVAQAEAPGPLDVATPEEEEAVFFQKAKPEAVEPEAVASAPEKVEEAPEVAAVEPAPQQPEDVDGPFVTAPPRARPVQVAQAEVKEVAPKAEAAPKTAPPTQAPAAPKPQATEPKKKPAEPAKPKKKENHPLLDDVAGDDEVFVKSKKRKDSPATVDPDVKATETDDIWGKALSDQEELFN